MEQSQFSSTPEQSYGSWISGELASERAKYSRFAQLLDRVWRVPYAAELLTTAGLTATKAQDGRSLEAVFANGKTVWVAHQPFSTGVEAYDRLCEAFISRFYAPWGKDLIEGIDAIVMAVNALDATPPPYAIDIAPNHGFVERKDSLVYVRLRSGLHLVEPTAWLPELVHTLEQHEIKAPRVVLDRIGMTPAANTF